MPRNDYDNNSRNYEEIQLGDDELNTVTTFKYLGSIFDSNGGADSDINNRVKLAWMKWKQLSGVLCERQKCTNQAERQGAKTINVFRACLGAQLTICAQK